MALLLPHSLFLHIPRTGGTWVRAAIHAAGIQTNEVAQSLAQKDGMLGSIKHAFLRELDDRCLFTFTFVRHPLAFYQSYWAYKMRRGPEDFNAFDAHHMHNDFCTFACAVVRDYPGWLSDTYARYAGQDGKGVRFVGKLEQLADDLVAALRLARERFDETMLRSVPPVNEASALPGFRERCRYTRELAEAVCESEKEAMTLYGYE